MKSNQAKAFYDATYKMVGYKEIIAAVNVFSGDENISFGFYSGRAIDISDIELLNNFGGKGDTKGAVLYRELAEQYMRNTDKNDNLEKQSRNFGGLFMDSPIPNVCYSNWSES